MSEFKNLDILADQLYQEGMEKARKESEKLKNDVEKKAEERLHNANKEAEEIISKAKKEAERYRSAVESEVAQKAKQVLQDLKNQIEELINAQILDAPTKKVLSDQDFVKQLILSSLETWKNGNELELSIPESLNKMKADLSAKVHKLLPGLKVSTSEYLDNGFKIENKDKGYILSFEESDFKALFEPYLTEKVRNILFGIKE